MTDSEGRTQLAQPKCPDCAVVGAEFLVTTESSERSRDGKAWFNIVHCSRCGHVYGVFAKHIFGPRGGPQLVVRERS
jgi:ribosomal protein S27E